MMKSNNDIAKLWMMVSSSKQKQDPLATNGNYNVVVVMVVVVLVVVLPLIYLLDTIMKTIFSLCLFFVPFLVIITN